MAETPVAEPVINTQAIADATRAALRSELDAIRQESRQQAQANAQARAQAAAVQQVAQDPLAQTLRPYIEPVARNLNLKADMAMDAVRFYNRHPEALKHEQAIENTVNAFASQGQAYDRDTAYKFVKGANFDQFVNEEIKHREEQATNAARAGMSIGASGVSGPHVGRLIGLGPNSKLEDLENALAGVAF